MSLHTKVTKRDMKLACKRANKLPLKFRQELFFMIEEAWKQQRLAKLTSKTVRQFSRISSGGVV